MCRYTHLSIEEREKILVSKESGKPIRAIARLLGRAPATVSRELRRNTEESGKYSAHKAQSKYALRKQRPNKPRALADEKLRAYVITSLRKRWSPEQISGRLEMKKGKLQVSFATIYRGLKDESLPKELIGMLRKRGLRTIASSNEKRGRLHGHKTIHQRPTAADERTQFGHFEGDTVRGALNKGCLATFVDRKSRYLIARRMPDRKADTLTATMIETFQNMKHTRCRTFTVDHGNEFFGYHKVEELLSNAHRKIQIFFADPYCSWQRGTNENTNGLIRQYFPKKSDFLSLTDEQGQAVVDVLNNRPRKILRFLTPAEFFRL